MFLVTFLSARNSLCFQEVADLVDDVNWSEIRQVNLNTHPFLEMHLSLLVCIRRKKFFRSKGIEKLMKFPMK